MIGLQWLAVVWAQVGRAMLELHIDESVTKAVKRGESADAIREFRETLDQFI